MTRHITHFDFLRGIAILMVVGIHTFPSASWDNPNDVLLIAIRQILNCAVPIFLALSAYFIANKKIDTSKDIFSFWKKQIPKVYIPCLFWSTPYLILSISNGGNILKHVVYFFFCGYSIYYFIALIIQFYLLTPLLVKINKIGGVMSIIISVLSISLYVYSDLQLPLILYAGPFIMWTMFYVQGIYISRMNRDYSYWILLLVLLLCILLQIIESKYLFALSGRGFGIKASAYIYSTVIIFLLFSQRLQHKYESKKNLIKRFIEYIGQISFGIYLIHMFVLSLVSKYFDIQNWIINWGIVLTFTILIIQILKAIFPAKITGKYLGIL